MQSEMFDHEFNKIFRLFGNENSPRSQNPDFEVYRKLWNFFLPGDSYWFVVNYHNLEIESVSKEVEEVMGYSPSEMNISLMNQNTHPEDLPWFLTFGNIIIRFFSQLPLEKLKKYKVRYDTRIRKKNGDYARILYQGILVEHDEEGKFLRSLNVHSDISYLKHDGKPTLSMIGMDGEPSYIDVGAENMYKESNDDLSKREKEVLILLIEGKPSKEIGSCLHISKQTVDTHRKNMLRKKQLSNTGELIGKAIRYGWI
jgi:DNA-binding CsgD family transcriptional regulator